MYAGDLVEIAPSQELFARPRHPYTFRLMHSFPTVRGLRRELTGIAGSPPDLISPPSGCRFHPRCDVALAGKCQEVKPVLREIGPQHHVACHLVEQQQTEVLS